MNLCSMFNVLSELGIFLQQTSCGLRENLGTHTNLGHMRDSHGRKPGSGAQCHSSQIVLWGQQQNHPFTLATRPAQGGMVMGGHSFGAFPPGGDHCKAAGTERSTKRPVCHRPGGACAGPVPSEGVWDPGQLCGGLSLLPGPRETPTATACRPSQGHGHKHVRVSHWALRLYPNLGSDMSPSLMNEKQPSSKWLQAVDVFPWWSVTALLAVSAPSQRGRGWGWSPGGPAAYTLRLDLGVALRVYAVKGACVPCCCLSRWEGFARCSRAPGGPGDAEAWRASVGGEGDPPAGLPVAVLKSPDECPLKEISGSPCCRTQ